MNKMKKTLVIVAHPNFANSLANKTIVNELKKNNSDIEVRKIAELYPDYRIDVKEEQAKLLEADTIVFQYPFYWYNMPAILKLWFDSVFEFQFAFGPAGDKLKGKDFIVSFTTGGPRESYNALGSNNFRVSEFTKILEQTAYCAQMNYIEPIYENGMAYIEGVTNNKEIVIEQSKRQAQRVLDCIDNLN